MRRFLQRGLAGEAFESLLGWLDDDRDRAGERYEAIRTKLMKVFVCRGCSTPEDLADATIDRVTSKLPEIAHRYVGPPEAYFYRVAQFIYFEHLRKRRPAALPAPWPQEQEEDDREADWECLETCLQRLSPEDRELILAYYRHATSQRIERRRQLAEEQRIGINALRLRLHRIRQALRECVSRCLEQRR